MHYKHDKINVFIVKKIYLLYAQNCTKESCQDFKVLWPVSLSVRTSVCICTVSAM